MQKNEQGVLQPCAYSSKKLSETEHRWAVWENEAYVVWEKEAYAMCWALLTWRHFLEGGETPLGSVE